MYLSDNLKQITMPPKPGLVSSFGQTFGSRIDNGCSVGRSLAHCYGTIYGQLAGTYLLSGQQLPHCICNAGDIVAKYSLQHCVKALDSMLQADVYLFNSVSMRFLVASSNTNCDAGLMEDAIWKLLRMLSSRVSSSLHTPSQSYRSFVCTSRKT